MKPLFLKNVRIIFSCFMLFFSQVGFCEQNLDLVGQVVERTIDKIIKSDTGRKLNQLPADELVELGRSASKAQDYSSAFTYLSIASRKNSAEACYMMGVMLDKGWWDRLQSTVEALRWYEKAINLGSSDAAVNAGGIFEEGRLGSPDYKLAAKWYNIAAKQGNALAHYNLGILHLDGRGVPKNLDIAVEHFRMADNLGGVPEARRMISLIMRKRNR